MLNDAAHVHQFGECDCREAELLRELVRLLDAPGELLDRLASTFAVWKLRAMSHELSAAITWSRWTAPYARRNEYEGHARSPEEIRDQVAASWADFNLGIGPLWHRKEHG
jgi:hypothetical protein